MCLKVPESDCQVSQRANVSECLTVRVSQRQMSERANVPVPDAISAVCQRRSVRVFGS